MQNYITGPTKVRCIDRAARILTCLGNGINNLSDISNTINLSKATVHRLLKALESSNLVMQDLATRQYYLGPLIISLTSNNMSLHQILILSAHEHMKHLADITGETVVLEVQAGTQSLCLEEIASREEIRFTLGRGTTIPLHAGAGGKVILSQLNKKMLKIILDNIELTPLTPNTIIDKRVLMARVDGIRQQGYSTTVQERLVGSAAIAVPIKNNACAAALVIVGPDNRFGSKMMDFLDEIRKRADIISKKLDKAFLRK